MTEEDNTDVIVAIKPCCNHLVFAAVNKPDIIDRAMKKDMAELVLSGCKIEHLPLAMVRTAAWGCDCNNQPET